MAAEQPQQLESEDTEEFLLDEMKKETMSFIGTLVKAIFVLGGSNHGFKLVLPDDIFGKGMGGPVGTTDSAKSMRKEGQNITAKLNEMFPNYIRNMVMYTNRLNAVYERQRNNTEQVNKAPSTSKPPPEVPLGEVSIRASTQPSVYEAVAARLQGGKSAYKKKQRGGYNWRSPGKKTKTRKTKTTTRTKTRTKTRSLKK